MLRGESAGVAPLAIDVNVVDPLRPIVTVGGDLDFQTVDALRTEFARLLADRPTLITVDVAGLRFIDSAGLAVLVHCWRHGFESGTGLELRDPPSFLAGRLELTGVDELLARPVPTGDDRAADPTRWDGDGHPPSGLEASSG